jgi:hypothetical protein
MVSLYTGKCNFIHCHKKAVLPAAPLFMNLAKTAERYVQISYAKLYPNGKIKFESMDRNLFTPLSIVWRLPS